MKKDIDFESRVCKEHPKRTATHYDSSSKKYYCSRCAREDEDL